MMGKRQFFHHNRPTAKDSYGQAGVHEYYRGVFVTVSYLRHQTRIENPRLVDATHLGLAEEKEYFIGDTLTADGLSYRVEYVISDTPKTQLFLKEESPC